MNTRSKLNTSHINKVNKRSKSTHQNLEKEDKKISNNNNRASIKLQNNLNNNINFNNNILSSNKNKNNMINSINEGPTYNLGMGGHSNSRKPQTPQQTEVNRRLQQTAKNQGNSTKGKKMFSSINKSIDNNYQNHQGSPRKSSKSVYTTLNNQQMLQQSANNNINNAQVLKKYLNSQNANNMLVMQQQKQQQSQNLVNNANSYNYPGGKIKYQRRNKISNNSYSLHSNNNIIPNSRKHINLNDENSINYDELFYKKQGMLNASSSQKNSSISMIQMSGNYNDSLIHSNSTFANPQIQDQYMKKKKEKDQKSQQAKKFLQQGKQYFKQNQLQNAIECFQQAISIDSDNLDSRYLMGVCFLQSLDYNKSISEFNQLLERNKAYKQNVYLLLSIAYKKKNDVNQAINMLGQAIKYFPKYYDAYIYRGKLLVKMKKYEQAVSDFEEAINLDQTKALGYIGKADCLRLLERYKDAIEFYGYAMQIDQAVRKVALLKRGITYSENNNIEESLQDFQSILDDDPCNSEACYFKGLQYLKLDNKNEANLAFEQAIKHNNSKNAVSKSLYEIAKIKIELRDFYQAFYTLQRSEFLDVDQELLKPFRMFTDSVTYLMKRKFQEGVDLLNQLILSLNFSKKSNNQSNTKQTNMNSSTDNIVSARKQGSNTDLLKQLVFSYRSYGLFCLGQHQKALNDLLLTEQQNKVLEEPNQYNKVICQGIVSVSEFKYEEAFELFKKAGQLQPKKMEPYFYKAMALCHQSKHKIDANDTLKKERYASNALMCMEKAESLNNQNAVFYYCRAVLLFSQNKLQDALKDIEQAIEKCEDNTADFFFIRGMIQATGGNYKEGLSDFSIALNLDEKYADAYIQRAKCYQLLEDRNAAFKDLEQYISMKPESSDIHLWAGHLLFNIGALEDAVKAYSHAGNIKQNEKLLQLRINCYMVSKELNFALNDMQTIIDLNGNQKVEYDFQALTSIKLASSCSQVEPEQFKDIFQEALLGLKTVQQMGKKGNFEGVIFKRQDVKFFQGIYYFYMEDYEKALRKFNKSIDCINNCEESQYKEYIEEYRFENLTYNIYEFQYNAAICYLMAEQFEEGLKLLEMITEIIPDEEKSGIKELVYYLQNELDPNGQIIDEDDQSKKNSENEQSEDKLDSEQKQNEQQEQKEKQIRLIQVFPTHNRLCSIFPEVQLPLKKVNVALRLSYCLPCVPIPNIEPKFEQNLLDILQPITIENKPEAPWIKKNAQGVIFTDNMLELQDDIEITDTQRENDNSEDEEDEEDDDENRQSDQQGREYEQHELEQLINRDDSFYDERQYNNKEDQRQSIRNQLLLDNGIEEKLNKLLKKKEEQKKQNEQQQQ